MSVYLAVIMALKTERSEFRHVTFSLHALDSFKLLTRIVGRKFEKKFENEKEEVKLVMAESPNFFSL